MAVRKIKVKDYLGYHTVECDGDPLGDKAMCWACLEPCDAYRRLVEERDRKYEERLKQLIEKYGGLGEIVETGRQPCLDCPERPHECRYCLRDPYMFEELSKPYIKILVKWDREKESQPG